MSAVALRRPRVPPEDDGRRRRGADNRARIVAAMLDIVRQTETVPSAEQVAARADVGLRTVFRHFQDMDSLYREMAPVIEGEIGAVVTRPFKGETWQARVVELVARRAGAYERIAPFLRAAAPMRRRSPYLAESHGRLVAGARALLVLQLPPDLARRRPLVEALDLLLSFESWDRLRGDQGLSPEAASETLAAAVRKLLA